MVGAPNFRNLKMMIRQKVIHNFPVTVENIDIAENIFDPGVVPALDGKIYLVDINGTR